MIETSQDIAELAKALSVAQGQIEGAAKGKTNPHFRSKYADLTSVWEACREALTKNGLAVVQQPVTDSELIGVVTTLVHGSGQWMRSTLWMKPDRAGPQAAGSCITYARRFSLASFVGVAPEDDDGEAASGRDDNAKPPGANWSRERSAPKASAPRAASPTARDAAAQASTSSGPSNDTGEVLDPGQLQDLTEAFSDKWGKGARTAAPSWLKAKFGTDNVASLTKAQATEALGELLASAS